MTGPEQTLESGAWRKLLAGLPAGEREGALTRLLRADVAAVLGYPHADALPTGKALADLGFDSLTAVQIRNRLSLALKLRLSAAVVFEHPTAEDLARRLLRLLDDSLPAPEVERPVHTLSSLFRKVGETGHPLAAMHMLVTASYALPTYGAAACRDHALPPIRRAGGSGDSGRPTIVYLPAYHPSSPSEGGRFPRFHRHFQGDLDVLELPHPGIGAGTAVPEDRETLVRTHAETAVRQVGDEPFVIVGRCAGGNVAYAVAHHLESIGATPAGLVLIDTYHINEDNSDKEWLLSLAAPAIQDLGQPTFAGDDDSALAAMGAYNRIFLGWEPEPVGTPTLLVRATEPTPAMAASPDGRNGNWRTSWPLPHDCVDVPGDHLTMMQEHAETTASAIRTWIDARTAEGDQ